MIGNYCCLVIVLGVASLVTAEVAAQTTSPVEAARAAAEEAKGKSTVKPAAPARLTPASDWTPPRTSWGDPDIQGIFTNKYEASTPLERPNAFEGRKLDDIEDVELREILAERQKQAIDRLPFLSGDPEGRIGPPHHWREMFDITGGSRPWLVIDPPDGRIPPLVDGAEQSIAARQAARGASRRGRGPADSYEDRSLYDRCISRGLPGSMMPTIYGNSYQIIQTAGYVVINYEMVHETRIIPLDGRPHLGATIRPHMGDARGRWEGNTLVVETTNFRDDLVYRNANPETLKIVERFTRTSPDRVEWSLTVEDQTTWTRPWTFSMPLTIDNNEPVFEYGCHEGNYALANILSAARAEEEKGGEDAAKK